MFNVDISNKHLSVKQKKEDFFFNHSHTGFGLLFDSLKPLLTCSCRFTGSLAFFILLTHVRLFSLCGCAALQPAHHRLAAFCGFGSL